MKYYTLLYIIAVFQLQSMRRPSTHQVGQEPTTPTFRAQQLQPPGKKGGLGAHNADIPYPLESK